jgi:phosphoribosylglycinamide formyltransferase-1
MKYIVIFASGSGTNVQQITEYFLPADDVRVIRVYVNRSDAGVLQRAKNLDIPAVIFNRDDFYATDSILDQLEGLHPDLIVLAGFLWMVPPKIINAFPKKIINIHPALLPKYGGKGMYGSHVHRAVLENREKESGITIHYVNENYDEGNIIMQAKCPVEADDTPETLAKKIHALEYRYYPKTIERILAQH